MARPYVLKPVNEGRRSGWRSSRPRAITATRSAATCRARGTISTQLLAEPFIKGRELTVAVLGDEALAVTELKPNTGFYDYEPNIPTA